MNFLNFPISHKQKKRAFALFNYIAVIKNQPSFSPKPFWTLTKNNANVTPQKKVAAISRNSVNAIGPLKITALIKNRKLNTTARI